MDELKLKHVRFIELIEKISKETNSKISKDAHDFVTGPVENILAAIKVCLRNSMNVMEIEASICDKICIPLSDISANPNYPRLRKYLEYFIRVARKISTN